MDAPRLAAQGRPNPEIARQRDIAPSTVKTQLALALVLACLVAAGGANAAMAARRLNLLWLAPPPA